MEDDFNKSDEVNLASFIRSTQKSNAGLAYEEAKKIYDQIDFKSYIASAIANSERSARIIFQSGQYGSDFGLSEIFAGEEKWSSVISKLCEIVREQGISCEPIISRYMCGYPHCQQPTGSSHQDEYGNVYCNNCGCEISVYHDLGEVKCRGLVISWQPAGH